MNFPYFLSKIMKDGCFGLKSSLLGQCLCHPIIEECVFLNSKKKMQVNSMLTSLFVRFFVRYFERMYFTVLTVNCAKHQNTPIKTPWAYDYF